MNQENYKKLANIINEQVIFAKGLLTGKEKEDAILLLTAIAYKQADYFEKEEIENKALIIPKKFDEDTFNRKQFLEWCGVE